MDQNGIHIADRPLPTDLLPDRPVSPVAAAALAAAPTNITRLLVLIRWIIGYGSELATTLHQRVASPAFQGWAGRYRQSDIATIAARIRRGLLLAAGLEAWLTVRAAQGHDLRPARVRPLVQRKPPSDAPKQPRAARYKPIIDLPLHCLPTAEQIAEELSHRPVGAVLVDICRDLGLYENDLPIELARVLHDTIIMCGGSLATLLFQETNAAMRERARARMAADRSHRAARRTRRRARPPRGSAEIAVRASVEMAVGGAACVALGTGPP